MGAPVDKNRIEALVERVAQKLLAREERLCTAESCTGGGIAARLTDQAGSSGWFERGYVTYSNESKHELLGVALATLDAQGAVSEATVAQMALGALAGSHADWAVSVSGIAGPDGGSPDKPVGTVCFGWAGPGQVVRTETVHLTGDRRAIREKATEHALEGLLLFQDTV